MEKLWKKTAFVLIIGSKNMIGLGIMLDFKVEDRMIIVNEIELSMSNIDKLPTSNEEALSFNNCIENNIEPISTKFATQRIVKLLCAKCEKANLSEIVRKNVYI